MDLRERRHGLRRVGVVPEVEGDAERFLEVRDRLVGLPERERQAADVVVQPPDVPVLGEILVDRLGLLGVLAREHPVALALGEQRGLEVRVRHRRRSSTPHGELERALDVFLRRLEVALPAVAPRARLEDLRTEEVAREPGALGELERRAEQRERRRDARELVAGDVPSSETTSARSTSEKLGPSASARARSSSVIAAADVAVDGARTRFAGERAGLELRGAGGEDRRREAFRTPRAPRRIWSERISASARASPPSTRPRSSVETPFARKLASTPSCCASHSIVSVVGPRLAALDLADVLLREPVARELALGQPGGDPEPAQTLAEAQCLRAS